MKKTTVQKISSLELMKRLKGQKATFIHFQRGEFWYQLSEGLLFTVPLSDIGDAKMLSQDDASLFKRWIEIEA